MAAVVAGGMKGKRSPSKNLRTKQRNSAKKEQNLKREMARILATQKRRGGDLSKEDRNFLAKYAKKK